MKLCRNSQGRGFSFQVPEPSTDGTAAPFISRMHDLADGPDETDQLTSDGHGGHRRSFPAAGHPMELSIQPQITSLGNVDQCLRLIFSSSFDGRPGGDAALILPRCLHGDVPNVRIAGLGD